LKKFQNFGGPWPLPAPKKIRPTLKSGMKSKRL